MGDDSKEVPNAWLTCPSHGNVIQNIFIPFKTLLDKTFNDVVPLNKRFNSTSLNKVIASHNIKMIIDLTIRSDFYSARDLRKISHVKLFEDDEQGFPTESDITKFINLVKGVIDVISEAKIGVHCIHGFNKTGFMIVAYLVKVQNIGLESAVDLFAQARPPGIFQSEYIEELKTRYDQNASIEVPPFPYWYTEKCQKKKAKPKAKTKNADILSVADDVSCSRMSSVTDNLDNLVAPTPAIEAQDQVFDLQELKIKPKRQYKRKTKSSVNSPIRDNTKVLEMATGIPLEPIIAPERGIITKRRRKPKLSEETSQLNIPIIPEISTLIPVETCQLGERSPEIIKKKRGRRKVMVNESPHICNINEMDESIHIPKERLIDPSDGKTNVFSMRSLGMPSSDDDRLETSVFSSDESFFKDPRSQSTSVSKPHKIKPCLPKLHVPTFSAIDFNAKRKESSDRERNKSINEPNILFMSEDEDSLTASSVGDISVMEEYHEGSSEDDDDMLSVSSGKSMDRSELEICDMPPTIDPLYIPSMDEMLEAQTNINEEDYDDDDDDDSFMQVDGIMDALFDKPSAPKTTDLQKVATIKLYNVPKFFVDLQQVVPITNSDKLQRLRMHVKKYLYSTRDAFLGTNYKLLTWDQYPNYLSLKETFFNTWTTDGIRYLLYLGLGEEVYFISEDNWYYSVSDFYIPHFGDQSKRLTETLFDGEFVIDHVGGQNHYIYLISNIYLLEGEFVKENEFQERLITIENVTLKPLKNLPPADKEKFPFLIGMKKFLTKSYLKYVWTKLRQAVPHKMTALLFYPYKTEDYNHIKGRPVYFWQPADFKWINFLLKSAFDCEKKQWVGNLFVRGNSKYSHQILNLSESELKEYNGKIVKCHYHLPTKSWHVVGIETKHKTAVANWDYKTLIKDVMRPVTFEELLV